MREPFEAREGREMIMDALAWEARDAEHAASSAIDFDPKWDQPTPGELKRDDAPVEHWR